MKIRFVLLLLATIISNTVSAQRFTDKLDRGLVAVKTSSGVFVSWRNQADEYYDVTYNLYRNGAKIASNLNTSNYSDVAGSTSSSYQVAAVVRGVEQEKCQAITPWATDYKEIKIQHDPSLKCTYIPNDACCADVDGDGELEILLKLTNKQEYEGGYQTRTTVNGEKVYEYAILEVLKLDGTVLWWVNTGVNMGDFQNNEQNIVGYDWDMDGKAEVVIRLCEGAIVHMADGSTYTVGTDGKNSTNYKEYRTPAGDGQWFSFWGNEYLYYCEGATGKPYLQNGGLLKYPCARFEPGESDLNAAWGDGYGHRAGKFFFGAPYLDGHKPSIFLGRGIYTRHKFVALDVNPATHSLSERWRWMNNSNGPWKGQGYHNYAIADVDMDGRDEIIWGSMVIDDNGKGLSTCGLGHGDAQHHGDFDPYTYGLEGFFCNESAPANNYRDLTTSKLYHRYAASGDDGRAIAGNFCGTVPGAMAFSAHENPISCVTGNVEGVLTKNGVGMNFNCFWDGDLLEETYNGGDNAPGSISKYNGAYFKEFTGSLTNNSTKATPCYKGDILGDWRDEFIVRTPNNNIRIYTTSIKTQHRMASLWYDHQYRNGMVWEPCGYNQPPHVSYFVGELEGYTAAPPSLTMTGRTEVSNGGTISGTGKELIMRETNNMTVAVSEGAAPTNFVDNAPSWVQGWAPSEVTTANDPTRIKYTYYTHTLTGGAFTGAMNLTKQGAGTLVMPSATHTYTGKTDVWEGQLTLVGNLPNSRVFLNRHTVLNAEGEFGKSIEAYYNGVIRPGGEEAKAATISCDSLIMRYGATAELDIFSEGNASDKINANVLVIEKKDWTIGPKYLAPVFRINHHGIGEDPIADGVYDLGTVGEIKGNLSNIIIEGFVMQKATLSHEDGKLLLTVKNFEAEPVTWTGANSSNWNVDADANFKSNNTESTTFLNGAPVTFDDNATNTNVVLTSNVAPASVTFANETKTYTLSGDYIIDNTPVLTKQGAGKTTINNINNVGNTIIEGGSLYASSLANDVGTDMGALGTKDKTITLKNGGTFGVVGSTEGAHKIICSTGNGQIEVPSSSTFTQTGSVTSDNGGTLTKKGGGTLALRGSLSASSLTIKAGTVDYTGSAYGKTVYLEGSSGISGSGFFGTPFNLSNSAKVTYNSANRVTSSNSLIGGGQITVVCYLEKGSNYYATRNPMQLKMSQFEGTLIPSCNYAKEDGRFTFDTSTGSANWTLNIPENIHVQNSGKTLRIGQLAGKGTLGGTCTFSNGGGTSAVNTWQVGNDKDFTSAVVVVDNAKLTKMGAGKMTVSSEWTTTGAVSVNEGELHVNSTKSLGTGALTVAEGATFSGLSNMIYATAKKYPITNSSVTVSGTMQCGLTSTTTSGSFFYLGAKKLTIKSTGTYRVGVDKCSTGESYPGCAHIFGDGAKAALVMEDGATVDVFTATTYDPAASIGTDEQKADSFCIFSGFATVSIGNVKFNLPTLPSGYYWDTTKFKTGYLYVRYTGSDAIRGIQSNEQVTVDIISANGSLVGTFHSTAGNAKAVFSRKQFSRGVYILRMRNAKGKTASIRMTR